MTGFDKLQKNDCRKKECEHKGYYYKISDALTIMVCGMLCNPQNILDIYEWAKAVPVQEFLLKEFNIHKLSSRAQIYNLIGYVNPQKFNIMFIKWVEEILKDNNNNKTIAIDGKTICSIDQRSESVQHIHQQK